jgi:hypothetical protein
MQVKRGAVIKVDDNHMIMRLKLILPHVAKML